MKHIYLRETKIVVPSLEEYLVYSRFMWRAGFKVVFIRVREALSRSGLPDLDYALNPYMGCWHSCTYCYARLYTWYREAADSWGQVVVVKENIVEVLRREVKRRSHGVVGVGTITDAYQPVEAVYKLTRESLKVLFSAGFHASIQTKNPLILRDLDLLVENKRYVDVGFTITTLNDQVARVIEPRAPPPRARAKALETIASHGIETWVFMGPIIPGYNDDDSSIEDVIRLAVETNSVFYYDKLRVKNFMYNPAHPLHHIVSRAKSYDWSRLYRRIEGLCRRYNVRCLPGMEYGEKKPGITLDRYISG